MELGLDDRESVDVTAWFCTISLKSPVEVEVSPVMFIS
jgi:hypothetical protein